MDSAPNARPAPDIETSIWIACPPEDIWKFLYDVSNDTQWRAGVNQAKWVSEAPYQAGSTGLHIIDGIGDWPWVATQVEEPHVMAWDVTGGRFEGSHGAYRIEPEGDGSRMTIETRMKHTFMINLIMLVMKGTLKRQNATDLEKLKTIMET
jgi:carbon monoxide dehydrogenase subunit G